jgi:hypothetical protein
MPQHFPDTYLRPEIRLEIGPLAAWLPHEDRIIRSYASEAFPKLFENPECQVRVTRAERTFWEKATILHHERATQDRVIALFTQQLGYRYLGNWADRAGNHCVEEGLLSAYLKRGRSTATTRRSTACCATACR